MAETVSNFRLKWFLRPWRAQYGEPAEFGIVRVIWDTGTPGDGKGYSSKLSFKFQFVPRDLWIGAYWNRKGLRGEWTAWICLVPCLPLRIRMRRAYGGRFA